VEHEFQHQQSTADPRSGYDAAGNQIAIGGYSYICDAESRLVKSTITQIPVVNSYDGDGRRVQKVQCPAGTNPCTSTSTGAQPTVYVYDAAGQLAAEYTVGWTPPPASCTTCYLTADHLGSGRVLTDTTGIRERHDYAPFGRELYAGTGPRTVALVYASSAVGEVLKVGFTGNERDAELSSAAMQGLDYFGARYLSEAQGRFASPDPVSGTVLHILSPQRWNMYTNAVNNPLAYVDLDGRDAIAVKFARGAHGLGHAGLASVHRDGKGRFADFGPQHAGSPYDAGKYTFIDFKTQITYGPDRKPTKASLTALANELADDEQQPRDSVSVAYYKTSEAETAGLDAYFDAANNQRLRGETPVYVTGGQDCIWFCTNGLHAAGIGNEAQMLSIPNLKYLEFWLFADQTATGTKQAKPRPRPDLEGDRKPQHKRCLQDRDGNCVQ
jgi:RHS repeat-associated protein